MSALDALLGIVQSDGVEVEGLGAINFKAPITAVANVAARRIDVSVAGVGGDVAGPSSSTDNAIARFNGTSGKTIQNSLVLVSDLGDVTIPAGRFVGWADEVDIQRNGATVLDTTSTITRLVSPATIAGGGRVYIELQDGAIAAFARLSTTISTLALEPSGALVIFTADAPDSGNGVDVAVFGGAPAVGAGDDAGDVYLQCQTGDGAGADGLAGIKGVGGTWRVQVDADGNVSFVGADSVTATGLGSLPVPVTPTFHSTPTVATESSDTVDVTITNQRHFRFDGYIYCAQGGSNNYMRHVVAHGIKSGGTLATLAIETDFTDDQSSGLCDSTITIVSDNIRITVINNDTESSNDFRVYGRVTEVPIL